MYLEAVDVIMRLIGDVQPLLPSLVSERSIAHKVLPSVPIVTDDMSFDLETDNMYKIMESGPDEAALELTITGMPTGRFFQGARYIIPITSVGASADMNRVGEEEYVTELAGNLANHIASVIDQHFFLLVDQALNITGKVIDAKKNPTRSDVVSGMNLVIDEDMEVETLVLGRHAYNAITAGCGMAKEDEVPAGTPLYIALQENKPYIGNYDIYFFGPPDRVGHHMREVGEIFADLSSEDAYLRTSVHGGFNISNVQAISKIRGECDA